MPNPSIAADLLQDELSQQQAIASDLRNPKSVKEAALRRVRMLEAQLGLDETPSYNGRPAKPATKGEPLPTLMLTLRELQDARNELKTLNYAQVGAIIHGLRLHIQKGDEGSDTASELLNRLLRYPSY